MKRWHKIALIIAGIIVVVFATLLFGGGWITKQLGL